MWGSRKETIPVILSLKKALFLDRDGVINKDYGYVHTPERCEFISGIRQVLAKAKQKNFVIIVVTNQSGIGRGYYTEQQFHQFMRWMNQQLDNAFDSVYFCPYHPKAGIGDYKKQSPNRKPEPGMILQAIKEHHIDPAQSLLIGDSEEDIIAANRADIGKAFYLSNQEILNSSLNGTTIRKLSEVLSHL
jgi:D-glycero-D-manno-heptose 1,7-bisphosphate phosphatase